MLDRLLIFFGLMPASPPPDEFRKWLEEEGDGLHFMRGDDTAAEYRARIKARRATHMIPLRLKARRFVLVVEVIAALAWSLALASLPRADRDPLEDEPAPPVK